MNKQLFNEGYINLLLNLLQVNTVTPMETGQLSEVAKAQNLYANFALERFGDICEVVYHATPDPTRLNFEDVPITIRDRVKQMGIAFWENQPSLVLRLGKERPIEETIMFNFHIDTVSQLLPVHFNGEKFTGRGAVDMKGPGVAVLAGIGAAMEQKPKLLDNLSILIQCVSGEEGGAMGFYGTKLLVEQGFLGHFNMFVEPTDGVYFDNSSTSMTARIDVLGNDSTDDAPQQGHNASLLLGYLAQWLMLELSVLIENEGGKMCLSGLHTGHMHNKVFGTGQLLINFAYTTNESGYQIKEWVETEFERALINFKKKFSTVPSAILTVKEVKEICQLAWIKKGIPVLKNRNQQIEQFLNSFGLKRNPEDQIDKAFTCDAMWAQRQDIYTVVYGPGSLAENKAHANGEYVNKKDLENFSCSIRDFLVAYTGLPPKKY